MQSKITLVINENGVIFDLFDLQTDKGLTKKVLFVKNVSKLPSNQSNLIFGFSVISLLSYAIYLITFLT